MYNLPKPKSQIQTILRDLIVKPSIKEWDYSWTMFRGYISTLRRKLKLKHKDKKFVNSFGRKSHYRIHFLDQKDKPMARKVYLKLTKLST